MDRASSEGERVRTSEATTVVDVTNDVITVRPAGIGQAVSRQRSFYEAYAKPVIDLVGAVVLLVLTSPILIAASIAIVATMGRPAILRQDRVGKGGKVFTIYKFRTMEPDRRSTELEFVGEDRRKTHKHPHDPRITAVGRFLRVWSLDELPQFINVLKGDMSLVGPRPEMVNIVAGYEPWQHQRHVVKPGITGIWQVSHRGGKALHEATDVDLAYIDQLSAWTDLKILTMTPLAALGLRRGF